MGDDESGPHLAKAVDPWGCTCQPLPSVLLSFCDEENNSAFALRALPACPGSPGAQVQQSCDHGLTLTLTLTPEGHFQYFVTVKYAERSPLAPSLTKTSSLYLTCAWSVPAQGLQLTVTQLPNLSPAVPSLRGSPLSNFSFRPFQCLSLELQGHPHLSGKTVSPHFRMRRSPSVAAITPPPLSP